MWLTLLLTFFLIQLSIRKPLNYSKWQNNGIISARRKSRKYDRNNLDIRWNIPSLLIVNFLMFGYQVKHCFSCLIHFLLLIGYEISAPVLGVCIFDDTLLLLFSTLKEYLELHFFQGLSLPMKYCLLICEHFFSSEILDKCREKWDEFVWGKNFFRLSYSEA